MSDTPAALLTVDGVGKTYAVRVLDGVRFDVRPGEVHALLGANGAGKSTLCKIIAGLTPATEGTMRLGGAAFAPATKQAAEARGVQIAQQELNLIPTLTVAENVLLNRLPRRFGVIDRAELHRAARAALDRFGLHHVATDALASSLGVGTQQMVEIATALDRDCTLLILDEPTAALSAAETDQLLERLRERREAGASVIYISHRLDDVAAIADRVTILRDGKWVCTEDAASLTTQRMVELMSGEEAGAATGTFASYATGEPLLTVESLSRAPLVRDVSLTVCAGERVGIAGLVGSGRTELVRAIFGADVATSGTVSVGDQPPTRFTHPAQAVDAGLALVTEDRKNDGLLLDLSIATNTTLAGVPRRGPLVDRAAERREATRLVAEMETRCRSIDESVRTLSGGNQQKVAVAKWLRTDARVYLFDEPTRGIDVAARRRIYRLFESLAAAGRGLVIVSSDLDELLDTCDRIAVMSAGRLVGTFTRSDWSRQRIMDAAFAGYLTKERAA